MKRMESFFQTTSQLLKHEHEHSKGIEPTFLRGTDREAFIRRFLQSSLPLKIVISNGVVFDATDERSGECDIIIYDDRAPVLNYGSTSFFLSQGVYAHIEVKSCLDAKHLKKALRITDSLKKLKRSRFAGDSMEIFSCIFAYEGMSKNLLKKLVSSHYKDIGEKKHIDAICVLNEYVVVKEYDGDIRKLFYFDEKNDALMIFFKVLYEGMFGDMRMFDLPAYFGLTGINLFHLLGKRNGDTFIYKYKQF